MAEYKIRQLEMGFRWIGACKKLKGGREYQEDNCDIFYGADEHRVMGVLADGLGGHKSGDKASKMAVDTAEQSLLKHPDFDGPENFLFNTINIIQESVLEFSEKHNIDARTTIVIVITIDNMAYITNVGDSRAYHVMADSVQRITQDDSIPEMMYKMGEITEEEMATHPDQGVLTKSIGTNSKITPKLYTVEMSSGDVIVLCSDGFWEQIENPEFLNLWGSSDIEHKTTMLCETAEQRGGEEGDNVSVCALRCEEAE